MADKNFFNDVKDVALPTTGDVGQVTMPNVFSLKVGDGALAFKADKSGIWLGGVTFADAVTNGFAVDMEGNIYASSLDLTGYLSKTGDVQELTGSIILRDGSNNIAIFIGDDTAL